MSGRKRTVQIKFYVTEEEKAVMDRVMQKMLRSLDEELQK